MPNSCVCARPRIYKVVIVGLKGGQFRALEALLDEYPVTLREVSPKKLLRLSGLDGHVVLTRFVNHKHSTHAERIAPGRVLPGRHGAAMAIADAIAAFFRFGARDE